MLPLWWVWAIYCNHLVHLSIRASLTLFLIRFLCFSRRECLNILVYCFAWLVMCPLCQGLRSSNSFLRYDIVILVMHNGNFHNRFLNFYIKALIFVYCFCMTIYTMSPLSRLIMSGLLLANVVCNIVSLEFSVYGFPFLSLNSLFYLVWLPSILNFDILNCLFLCLGQTGETIILYNLLLCIKVHAISSYNFNRYITRT